MRLGFMSLGLMTLCLGCEEKEAEPTAAAEPAPEVPAPPPPAEPVAAPVVEKKKERPTSIEMELSSERRSAVESKYSDAKGFIVAKDIEDKLKANEAIKEKEGALAQFDRRAKGKWVLFTGSAINLTETGFNLAIVYTPQLPNDPMGMSRQFFEVTFEDVEGYSQDELKVGNPVVVLAKYQGGGKAGPGHELVATEVWK